MSYGLIDEEGGNPPLTQMAKVTKNPANTTDALEKVLQVDGGIVIDTVDNEVRLTRLGGDAIVYFGILVDNVTYTIEVHGKTKDLKDDVIAGRQNPMVTAPNSTKEKIGAREFSHSDFASPKLTWILQGNNGKILETNSRFWEQLRRRIRAGHPLSLNIIH